MFGTLKRSYCYQRVRYRGVKRNALEMWFKLMAYNLRRADKILQEFVKNGGSVNVWRCRIGSEASIRFASSPDNSWSMEDFKGAPTTEMPLFKGFPT